MSLDSRTPFGSSAGLPVRVLCRFSAAAVFVLAASSPFLAVAERPPGVVLILGEVDAGEALAGAHAAGGATFRAVTIRPRKLSAPPPPEEAVAVLRRLYIEGDFLGCLGQMQDPALALPALLGAGHRDAAAAVATWGGACAFGAGDQGLAERLVARAIVADLNLVAIAQTTPEFQAMVESRKRSIDALGRVSVRLETNPSGATVRVNGSRVGCEAPCRLVLRPGDHQLVLTRLGYLPRILELSVADDTSRRVALDPAPAEELELQLAEYLARTRQPDRTEIAVVASEAFGARVLALAWSGDGRAYGAVWDRGLGRIVARSAAPASTAEGIRVAVYAAVREWRGVVEPRPLARQPLFWTATIGAAVLVGIGTWLLVRPPRNTYVLQVP